MWQRALTITVRLRRELYRDVPQRSTRKGSGPSFLLVAPPAAKPECIGDTPLVKLPWKQICNVRPSRGFMRNSVIALVVAAEFCLIFIGKVSAAPPSKSQAQIARGEYLVKAIGQCGDCHTPFTMTGGFVMEKWLQGKKLEFAPIVPIPFWADTAPSIAGLPGWDTEKAVQFFMTGLAPNGQPARPPMPGYRMNRADAEAVVAYLKSLKAPEGDHPDQSAGTKTTK